ncbi:MAG: ABC transporter substrate-binding protein [Desulfobacterales bacterium]|nr:ABC transporter substrate-binding protein [Desulfobacterales bacterium]
MKKIILLLCCTLLFSLAVMAAEPVRIIFIVSETGIAAQDNAPYIPMAELAVDEINRHGGLLGNPAELIILDNKSTRLCSGQAAEQAVSLQPAAVVGAIWSSHSLAMAPILQKAKIPMITPTASNPKITLVGDYIFRVCFTDDFQKKIMATFAYNDLRAKTAAVLKIVNEEYSLKLGDSFAETFEKCGGKILLQDIYKVKAIDFSNILKKIAKSEPDAVFVPGYPRDSGLIIKQAVSMGIQSTFIGGDGWEAELMYDYGGDALEGSFYSTHWHPDIPSSQSRYLKKIYTRKYGTDINFMSVPLTYEAFMVLADAIRRAGSADHSAIRDALSKTQGFQGATGTISFDENGDTVNKDAVIMKMGKKSPEYFKTIRQYRQ